jgi:hypothetical protein
LFGFCLKATFVLLSAISCQLSGEQDNAFAYFGKRDFLGAMNAQ